jgi:hypothetical protein
MRALRALESFEDHGLVDAGVAAATLGALDPAGLDDGEAAYLRKVVAKLRRAHAERLAALGEAGGKRWLARALDRVERWLDPLDSIRRRGHATQVMKDLVARRISHARAAIEMRRLYERQKGGWLGERLAR